MNNKYTRKYSIGIEDKGMYIFPFLSSFSIADTSQLSTYPLVTKEKVSDHMFNDLKKVTLGGSLSNFGINTEKNKHFENYIFEYPYYDNEKNIITFKKSNSSNSTYLIRMYQFFEALKKNNVILKIKSPSLILKNCVIDSLTWNEYFNNADFTLGLSQIKTYTYDDIKTYDIAPDPNLPIISDPTPQSFISSVLTKESWIIQQYIYDYFGKLGIVDDSFKTYLKDIAISVGGYVAANIVVGSIIALVATLSTNPAGWITLIIVAIAAAIFLVYRLVSRAIQRRKIWKKYGIIFYGYKNKDKMKKSAEQYDKYINRILESLKVLEKVFNSYEISQNINQDLLIDLGGEYYILRFSRQKINEKWKITLLKNDNTEVKSRSDIPYDVVFFKLTNNNRYYENNGERLYFIYKQDDKNNKGVFDLTKLVVLTSKFNVDKIKESVGQIAIETLKRKDV